MQMHMFGSIFLRHIAYVCVIALGFLQNIAMADETGARNFVENLVNEGVTILKEEGNDTKDIQTRFGALLAKNFAIDKIARHVLAVKVHKFSGDQFERFKDIYKKRLLRTYSDPTKTKKFLNMLVSFDDNVKKTREGYKITSVFTDAGGKTFTVIWALIYEGSTYKIVDVIMEGISTRQMDRSQYQSIFKGDVESGLQKLS